MNKSNTNNSNKRKNVYSNDKTPIKTLQDLNMMDSFLFEATTEDIENAKKIAKVIIRWATEHDYDMDIALWSIWRWQNNLYHKKYSSRKSWLGI